MDINQIMTKDVITVKKDMDVHALAKLFIEHNISGAPVVDDDGALIGLVLEEGIIFQDKKVHLPTFINIFVGFVTLDAHRYEEEIKKIAGSCVADIMKKDFVQLSPEDIELLRSLGYVP